MAPPEVLTEFREYDAREVARWPTSIEEVRLWAGSDPADGPLTYLCSAAGTPNPT